jgi:rhamnosyltransferase
LKAAVLVSYFPDQNILNKTLNSLVRQVDRLYWVDNGTGEDLPHETAGDNVVFIGLKNNIGIAAAQNIGIKVAIREGAEFVILSDQDTYFPSDCVDALVETFSRWPEAAAVVPQFRDKNKKTVDGFILYNTVWF